MPDQASLWNNTLRSLGRLVSLGFAGSILLILVYLAGTYQGFADATQLWLLDGLRILSPATAFAGLFVFVGEVASRRTRLAGGWKRPLWLGALILACAAIALGSSVLLVFVGPR